jgi:hypothetical protein
MNPIYDWVSLVIVANHLHEIVAFARAKPVFDAKVTHHAKKSV